MNSTKRMFDIETTDDEGLDPIDERGRTSITAKMISKMSFLAMAPGPVDAYPP